MKMKVAITERELKYEEKSRDTVVEKYEMTYEDIYKQLEQLVEERDTLSLFKFIQSDLERQKYLIMTHEWAKEKGLSEMIGFLLKLPGLKIEERYVMYTFLAFSKGLSVKGVVDADHPGDLERVIFKVYPAAGDLKEYHFLNTAAHGYAVLMEDDLGKHKTLPDAVKGCEVFLQPGDHAMGLLKPEELTSRVYIEKAYTKIINSSTFVRMFTDGLTRFFRRVTGILRPHSPFDAKHYYEFYFLESDELKDLDIDLDTYMNQVFNLDRRILKKIKDRGTFSYKLKKNYHLFRNWIAQKFKRIKTWNELLQLDKLEDILWRTPIFLQDNELSEYRKAELTKAIFSDDDIQAMEQLELYISRIERQVDRLKKMSFEEQEKYFGLDAIKKFAGLSVWAKIAVPSAIDTLFNKTLWDWAYPEKSPFGKKIFRLFASPASFFFYKFIQRYLIHHVKA
ncbi:MAG: hypothetical protein ACFFCD_02645 [Promethearchaeota archaeon]